LDLVPIADDSDDLDDEERRLLHEALARSEEDVKAGRVVPWEKVLANLRSRR
jgi:predicted transcriptional regulator